MWARRHSTDIRKFINSKGSFVAHSITSEYITLSMALHNTIDKNDTYIKFYIPKKHIYINIMRSLINMFIQTHKSIMRYKFSILNFIKFKTFITFIIYAYVAFSNDKFNSHIILQFKWMNELYYFIFFK